jgi:hypothetical protein
VGVYGYASATTGTTYGGKFRTDSPDGYGVLSEGRLRVDHNSTTDKATLRLHELEADFARLEFTNTNTARKWHIGGLVGTAIADDRLNFWNSGVGDILSIRGDGTVVATNPSTADNAFALHGIISSASPGASSAAVRGQNNGTGALGIGVWGSQDGSGLGVYGTSVSGRGVYGYASATSGFTYGVYGESASTSGRGVYGRATATSGATFGVSGVSYSTAGTGVFGYASATNGTTYGVYGESASTSGTGVYGYALAITGPTYGVYGQSASTSGTGVYGYAPATTGTTYGVYGQSDSTTGTGVVGYAPATTGTTYGVYGRSASTSGRGVYGLASATSGFTYGVYGESASTSGTGVYGLATATSGATWGVYGRSASTSGRGVYGLASATSGFTYGVYGQSASPSGTGVYGRATATSGTTYGVYGRSDSPDSSAYGVYGAEPAGGAGHAVYAFGSLAATGTKSFQIDHPLHPETHYLNHFCTEAPEPLNAYSGNVITDAQGYATIQLPPYFESINRDFRYQLTVIDDSDDFVLAKVVRKIQNNQFVIRTSKPFVEVSWRVEAVRNDLWVQRYGYQTEQEKEKEIRGKYLHPELYGQPKELGIHYRPEPEPAPNETAKP